MKTEILKIDKSLNDAVVQALLAIEEGKFNKVIKLLEYVKANKEQYDFVMVEYALLISYVNTGKTEKAAKSLEQLEEMNIENDQIVQVIESIKTEVLNSQANEKKKKKRAKFKIDEMLKKMGVTKKEVIKFRDLHVDDYTWSLILAAMNNLEDSKKELEHEFYDCYDSLERMKNQFLNYEKGDDSVTALTLFEGLNRFDKSVIFWGLIKKDLALQILNNRALPKLISTYFIERLAHYVHYGIIEDFEVELKGNQTLLSELPNLSGNFFSVANEIQSFYDVDNDNLYDMVTSVLNIVYIYNFPKNIYDELDHLEAVVGYIVNDIFIGREFDKEIEINTGYKFSDVKDEIMKLEVLITFLIN